MKQGEDQEQKLERRRIREQRRRQQLERRPRSHEQRVIDAVERRDQSQLESVLTTNTPKERQTLVNLGLSYCCQRGPHDLVPWLLTNITDVNQRLKHRLTPLSLAAHHGQKPILQSLLASPLVEVNACDENGRTALMYAQDVDSIDILLMHGADLEAKDKHGNTALIVALLRHRKTSVIRRLIEKGARIEACDHRRRTVLVQAVWKNRIPIVRMLLQRNVEIARRDNRGRNVFHHLASDVTRADEEKPVRKRVKPNSSSKKSFLIRQLLNADPSAEHVNAQDQLDRTPLHWAAVSGNSELVELLVKHSTLSINKPERKKRTPLHLAVANNHTKTMEILLHHGADVDAKTDAGLTPLHIACVRIKEKGPVDSLINKYKADIDQKNRSGKRAIHLAAQAGNWTIMDYLMFELPLPKSHLRYRDDVGNTPLNYVAWHRSDTSELRRKILTAFSPWRCGDALDADAKEAAENCRATVMDFRQRPGMRPRIERPSVYDLLYAPHSKHLDQPARAVLPPETASFRWIHLPTNNTAWCLDLITKHFIEKGAVDVHTFTALERSFRHQHRGLEPHSRYMTPLCQTIIRSWSGQGNLTSSPESIGLTRSRTFHDEGDLLNRSPVQTTQSPQAAESRDRPAGTEQSDDARWTSQPSPLQTGADGRSDDATITAMYLFTPFLHFESFEDRQEMQQLADQVFQRKAKCDTSPGAALFRAHLGAPHFPLHMRRTLDQSFYRNMNTADRDKDQVIHRYQDRHQKIFSGNPVKLLMVDQLWMWVLHDNLVLTSFPQPWRSLGAEGEHYGTMWEDIAEVILSSNRDPVRSVHELAMIIAGRCFSAFDRYTFGKHDLQFLDMFEASIGEALDTEVKLFETFNSSSQDAFSWLFPEFGPVKTKVHAASRRGKKAPDHIKDLFDIGSETNLLKDIKDIIDELDILTMIFECQEKQVLPAMQEAMTEIAKQRGWSVAVQSRIRKGFIDHQRIINHPNQDVDRMRKLATRIERSIKDLLDLKQKQVNVIEARASGTQAENTVSQGNILMIFTTFSVIFLPLSFIASFFTINISQLPQGTNGNLLSLGFVTRIMFGAGVPVALICVLAAVWIDTLTAPLWWTWDRVSAAAIATWSSSPWKLRPLVAPHPTSSAPTSSSSSSASSSPPSPLPRFPPPSPRHLESGTVKTARFSEALVAPPFSERGRSKTLTRIHSLPPPRPAPSPSVPNW